MRFTHLKRYVSNPQSLLPNLYF